MPIQGLPTKTHVCDLCVVGGGLTVTFRETHGAPAVRLFACDIR